jgi:predicted flap endonuclease-1-like 5' DNA nuclease
MFEQAVTAGPGIATYATHTFEIITMLLGAFLLGLWMGWLLWSRYKQQAEQLGLENQSLKGSLVATQTDLSLEHNRAEVLEVTKNELVAENTDLEQANTQLATQLDELEGDIDVVKAENSTLENELVNANASTPESANVPLEVVHSPVDVHIEDLAAEGEASSDPMSEGGEIMEEISLDAPEVPSFSEELSLEAEGGAIVEDISLDAPEEIEVAEVSKFVDAPEVVAETNMHETIVLDASVNTNPQPEPIALVAEPEALMPTTEVPRTVAEPITIVNSPSQSVVRMAMTPENLAEGGYITEVEATSTVVERQVVSAPAEAVGVAATATIFAAAASDARDNLKVIEGIGPKIEEILFKNKVTTYPQLAATPVSRLREMLIAEGNRYAMHDPATWPAQSLLAANEEWENLKAYQSYLNAGKKPD